ncbi:MAG: hypothetical protein DCC68_18595 [Planctomycetota bacterium]|nr:MAG: hypothetical protein DCC68_18595 [Planctomycetota bacterium]
MPPAARISDMHTCPLVNPGPVPHVGGPIVKGEPTVIVGFMPAARVTDTLVCVGPPDMIAKGSTGVMIGYMPAARLGDMTVHGGVIVVGMPQVMIGEMGGGGAGGGGGGGGAAGPPGTITVQMGGLTVTGTPADVAQFMQMIATEARRSGTMNNLYTTLVTDTANPVNVTLVRNTPNVWVDAYDGNGNQRVNMDYFDNTEFPDSPSANHPDAVTQGENLVHALDEAHHGAELQNANGNDPSGNNWYNESHDHAIDAENDYRHDRGQASNLTDSNGGPGPNDVTFNFDNGASEVHDTNTHSVTHNDSSGNPIP